MRISDWSSDVCSSDLAGIIGGDHLGQQPAGTRLIAKLFEIRLADLDIGRRPRQVGAIDNAAMRAANVDRRGGHDLPQAIGARGADGIGAESRSRAWDGKRIV